MYLKNGKIWPTLLILRNNAFVISYILECNCSLHVIAIRVMGNI